MMRRRRSSAGLKHWAWIVREILRDAVHRHLATLNHEHEGDAWLNAPLTAAERSLSEIADWGPAEDWADWGDAAG
jgi:hypothetical protein